MTEERKECPRCSIGLLVPGVFTTCCIVCAGVNDSIAALIKEMQDRILRLQSENARLTEALRVKEEAHERELQRLGSIEEKSHLQTIDERDRAEDALSQAYFLITGRSPEWSNLFGHDEALNEIDDFQKCVRAVIKTLEAKCERLGKRVCPSESPTVGQEKE